MSFLVGKASPRDMVYTSVRCVGLLVVVCCRTGRFTKGPRQAFGPKAHATQSVKNDTVRHRASPFFSCFNAHASERKCYGTFPALLAWRMRRQFRGNSPTQRPPKCQHVSPRVWKHRKGRRGEQGGEPAGAIIFHCCLKGPHAGFGHNDYSPHHQFSVFEHNSDSRR